ncbi:MULTISPECIES: plant virulence effector HPE1-like domain-containing protein [unclassified Rhizobium]|uniref:plant virulence effector HPE1-like domain-containing protein n=1 Tax=unclassified Rhizobium TaxID=2613769 RepID=UPI001781D393|nr:MULTISPECIES: plant virulence effector HPE1-like domain-containing protein [unclassified Rhizobium]MBD8685772.1 hypothetical protein [Rhizobium sp. CFBP 13644]MBD8690555.1 hypothetical protein [Rhizobium sp. CFBP 13717]
MRKTLLTVALVLASGSAMASSIEIIGQNRTSNGSVVSVICAACPPAIVKSDSVAAPTLAAGTQDVSIRDVDGKKQLVRTEAWLGGSPVTFVSSNALWLPEDTSIPNIAEHPLPGTDAVQTSAVSSTEPKAQEPQTAPLFSDAPLRPTL